MGPAKGKTVELYCPLMMCPVLSLHYAKAEGFTLRTAHAVRVDDEMICIAMICLVLIRTECSGLARRKNELNRYSDLFFCFAVLSLLVMR